MLNNTRKFIDLKTYGMLIESDKTIFLSVNNAYSLEEAFLAAKLEFQRQNPSLGMPNFKISLFTVKSKKDLTNDYIETQRDIREYSKGSVMEKIPASDLEIYPVMDMLPEEIKKIIFSDINLKKNNPKKEPEPTPVKDKGGTKPPELSNEEKNRLINEIIVTKDKKLLDKNKKLFTKAEIGYIKSRIK